MVNNRMKFLEANDSLANEINEKANKLYSSLKSFDTSSIEVDETYKHYFVNHHLGSRLFFSLQNSAHILYESITKTGKPVHELSAIDYGAGLGTLFMLGGMLGFRRFVYNDYLPDWQQTAASVCRALDIHIDAYVTGDIDAVMEHAKGNNIRYDIIASRNVIEHIYSLPGFYKAIYEHNKYAVTYSTTTANYHNPAMHLLHYKIHKKAEKNYYRQQRLDEIKKIHPSLEAKKLEELATLTRGKGQQDFMDAVNNFIADKPVAKDSTLRTNTCDCINGVWTEHLLTKNEYRQIIEAAGFKMDYTAGYWDTHYAQQAKNLMGKGFNKLITLLGKKNGIVLSPFVNVVAYN